MMEVATHKLKQVRIVVCSLKWEPILLSTSLRRDNELRDTKVKILISVVQL